MNGLLVIDKPQGLTSHTVVQRTRHVCGIKRVGHAGTLDPLATGLLIVAVGTSTRLIEFLVAGAKTYRATFTLGRVTDSQDITGETVAENTTEHVTPENICSICTQFVGEIEQIPPMFSALKKNGVPLYRLARKGVEVDRQKRFINITQLTVEKIDGNEVTIVVDCSKGTYIRTLCHDIGQRLGCGACMSSLRRLSSGCFDESMAISMDALVDGKFQLLPPSMALSGMATVRVAPSGRQRLANGIPPALSDLAEECVIEDGGQIALFYEEKLLAIASYDPEHKLDVRGDFKLLKVFPDGI